MAEPESPFSTYELAPPIPVPVLPRQDFSKEFVWGGLIAAVQAIRAVLPQYVDDVQRDFGIDVYERMMTDAVVCSSVDVLIDAILGDGLKIETGIQMPVNQSKATQDEISDALQAAEYCEFAKRVYAPESLDGDTLEEVCREMLTAIAYGVRVGEITYKQGAGNLSGKLVPKFIKPKKLLSTAFVIDQYGTVLGLVAGTAMSGGRVISTGGVYFDSLEAIEPFLPREKCLVFSCKKHNADPRGTSFLRSAYNPWFIKTQIIPEYFKFLRQFSVPGIIGYTPENAASIVQTDQNGNPMLNTYGNPIEITAEQDMLTALMNWQNGESLALKGGSKVDMVQSRETRALEEAFAYFDRQIQMAILGTTRLTGEAQHGSKADSGTAQDVVGLRVAYLKYLLASTLTRDLLKPLMRINFGEDSLRLMPKFTLARTEQQDFAAILTAGAQAYSAGLLKDAQLPEFYAAHGLPSMTLEEIQSIAEDKRMAEALSQQQLASINDAQSGGNSPLDALQGDSFGESDV